MKPKTLILMVVAIACGLGASYMTSRLLADRSGEEEQPKVTILVAKKHLDMSTLFKNPKDNVEEKVFVKGTEPRDAVTSYEKLKGKYLKVARGKGDFILPEHLTDEFSILAVMPGMRAMGLRVTIADIAGGFASLPGSRVDIISNVRKNNDDDTFAQVLLRNVLVLAADTNSGRPEAGAMPASTVTVALSPEDALRASLAQDQGPLRLLLRNPADPNTPETDRVTLSRLYRKGHSTGPGGSDAGFDTASVGGDQVPVVGANKPKQVVKQETPLPLPVAPVVRKHMVTVVEGDHARKVAYLLNENGEVNQEEVTGGSLQQLQPLGPQTTPPAASGTNPPPLQTPAAPKVNPGSAKGA